MDDQTLKLLAIIRAAMRSRQTFNYGQSSGQTNTATSPPQWPVSETDDDTAEPAAEDMATGSTQVTTAPPIDDEDDDNFLYYPTEVIVVNPTESLDDDSPIHASSEKASKVTVVESNQPIVVEPTRPMVVEATQTIVVGSGDIAEGPRLGAIPKKPRCRPVSTKGRSRVVKSKKAMLADASQVKSTQDAGKSQIVPEATKAYTELWFSREQPTQTAVMVESNQDAQKPKKANVVEDLLKAEAEKRVPKLKLTKVSMVPPIDKTMEESKKPIATVTVPIKGTDAQKQTKASVVPPVDKTMEASKKPIPTVPMKETDVQKPTKASVVPPIDKTMDEPKKPIATVAAPKKETDVQKPTKTSVVPPIDKTMEASKKAIATVTVPMKGTDVQKPTKTSVVPPIDKTMEGSKKPIPTVPITDAQTPTQSTMVAPNQSPGVKPKEGTGIRPIAIENLMASSPVGRRKSKKKRRKSTASSVVPVTKITEAQPVTKVTEAKPTVKETEAAAKEALQAALAAVFAQFPDPMKAGLRVAMIGQSPFAVDVMERLHSNGHTIVGVFTVLDERNREDPLAQTAKEYNIPVFKYKTWRIKGQMKPDVWEQYKSVDAELNVLAYCSQYIPMEVINYPRFKSICYHPSILPRHRGASAINWTLMSGDSEAGFTIFWADDGLDTGPILLQDKIKIQENDTVDTLYRKFLYPAGVTAMEKAVDMIAQGVAPSVAQNETLATYDPLLNKPELMTIDFKKKGREIHDFIRGLDSVPGARFFLKASSTATQYEEAHVFGSSLWKKPIPKGTPITIDHGPNGVLHEEGIILFGSDGVAVNVTKIKIGGRFKPAHALDKASKQQVVEFTEEEQVAVESIRKVWEAILKIEVDEDTDFFACGAGSMDVVRLIEEVKELMDMYLDNEEIFMAPVFDEFSKAVILRSRQATTIDGMMHVEYTGLDVIANNRVIRVPKQMFIDGKFVDSSDGKTTDIINPTDETVICKVPAGTVEDVNKAVAAAKKAFEEGEWGRISARERGNLLLKLSYFLEDSKEQLATLEAVDSGAVYTLALKTHVGMSIEAWRYFGGWADKIQGSTIPISDARPNKNLSFTKKEPIGVCGLITPWNYPLMMLSWKMAACLAAGNTVVIKPAQVCPLTALKFAELTVRAGIPPGVINIVTGSGSVVGNAIASHPDVRKVGFTGSTDIGKVIMQTCTDNLKKISLELGGKSPLVIFADCDMDKAVKLGMQSVFFNKGENCIAAGRIFVESSIYTEFIHRVLKETKKIAIGDPLNRATSHGPQNHLAHLKKLEEFVQAGLDGGARLVYGGKRLSRPGYFFPPTILADVEDHMYVAKEESFGPIMCISKFDNGDMDGVIKRANATEYGLASGVFTQDISKALKFADKIDAGTVFINTYNKTDVAAPFGGFKQSGFGKDLGQEALNEYLKTKTVTIEY